ncbi:helix-turn-helix domain-containing protein [Bifidobacterium bifidum]|uniref:helix-turn-helix domain-containing protein n=1 Tax=Bifidobacterium bifidum TaxID=1681 RepID=UPI001B22690B|nr:hypothetical protein MCC01971_03650 [Bifidobacteriaceae bacterium MCC01971]
MTAPYAPYSPVLEPLAVTISEATRLLGFKDTKSTYNLIHQGKIRARKSGRIYLVSYASLKKYVEG